MSCPWDSPHSVYSYSPSNINFSNSTVKHAKNLTVIECGAVFMEQHISNIRVSFVTPTPCKNNDRYMCLSNLTTPTRFGITYNSLFSFGHFNAQSVKNKTAFPKQYIKAYDLLIVLLAQHDGNILHLY